MKKDKKFLIELNNELNGISKKQKDIILLKYKNTIIRELRNNKSITKILNEFGTPREVAKREILNLNKKKIFNKKKDNQKKDKNKKTKKIKIEVIREYDINDSPKIKNQIIDSREVIEIEKEIKEENKQKKVKKVKERKKINYKELISKINIFKKIDFSKINIFKKVDFSKINIFKKVNFNKINIKNKIKQNVNNKNKVNVNKNVKYDVNEENINDSVNSIIIPPLTREQLVLRIIGTALISILLIILCISSVLFMSSIFAYLDGVKIIGIPVSLFGFTILVLIIVLSLSKAVYKKKNNFKLNLYTIIFCVLTIALGITFSINFIKNLDVESDPSDKYSMTSKVEIINLPKNNSALNLIFNSEYDIQYVVKFDNNYNDKVKIETKYYEEYYDYYIKRTNNEVYVSLNTDFRDRVSVYIDDIKENKVYKNSELKRYIVKLTLNEKDYSRLNIID